jgi:hypothetical protein
LEAVARERHREIARVRRAFEREVESWQLETLSLVQNLNNRHNAETAMRIGQLEK